MGTIRISLFPSILCDRYHLPLFAMSLHLPTDSVYTNCTVRVINCNSSVDIYSVGMRSMSDMQYLT